MLPLLATSLATVAGVMLFGGDIQRLFFVFPTYQINSFKVVDFSLSLPLWNCLNTPTPSSIWSLYEETFCKDKSRWQCLLWDWEGFLHIVNNIEADIMNYVTNWGEEKSLLSTDGHPYSSFELSAEIHAGISINNKKNSFGAHLHRAILDIYHPDWEGKLVNIGSIHDRENVREESFASEDVSVAFPSEKSLSNTHSSSSDSQNTLIITDRQGNATNHVVMEEIIINGFESPSFSILPRQVITTVEDAISINLKSLSPRMISTMAYQFIKNGRVLHITSTAVVFLKTLTSPMSVTAGAICDNTLKFTPPSINSLIFHDEKTPWFNIDEVNCRIERLSTGWGNITKMRGELRDLLLSRRAKAG
jgi:hypothetical protein